jgi:hypothetical protein
MVAYLLAIGRGWRNFVPVEVHKTTAAENAAWGEKNGATRRADFQVPRLTERRR